MTLDAEEVQKPEGQKLALHRLFLPLVLAVCSSMIAFALGSVRADSAQQTQLEEMRLDIQKVRAMPAPDQVVTKDQLTEIVRRLDERTEQISQDVQYLREREERRAH